MSNNNNPYHNHNDSYYASSVSASAGGYQPSGVHYPSTYTYSIAPGIAPTPLEGQVEEVDGRWYKYSTKLSQWLPTKNPNTLSKISGDTNITSPSEGDMIRQNEGQQPVDAAVVRTTIYRQLLMLESMDDLDGDESTAVSDASFFLREAIESLNRILE